MAQLVAHHTGSVGVTGSNPVSSTTFKARTLAIVDGYGPGLVAAAGGGGSFGG